MGSDVLRVHQVSPFCRRLVEDCFAFGVRRSAFGVRARARAPDFAPSSETPDFALSSKLEEAMSGEPESYVGQAGRLRRAGCARIRLRGVLE
jgi:hypothetical protein